MNAACVILPAETSYLWFDLFIVYRNNIIWRQQWYAIILLLLKENKTNERKARWIWIGRRNDAI